MGDLVWKTHDAEVEQRLRRTYDGLSAAELRKVPVEVAVSGAIGQPLMVRLRYVCMCALMCVCVL